MTDTANLGLPFIEGSQAQKHVTHNEALRILDTVIQIAVADMNRTAPPADPAEGQRHVVAGGPGGAWAGHAQAIATWQEGAWSFLMPKAGWCLWSIADAAIFTFDGGAWQMLSPPTDNVGRLGVNTVAAAPNLFSVRSNNALFTALETGDGGNGDARVQISKQAPGRTASVVFADSYSGRAEFGLTGDDDFHLKVSADGATWRDAFVIDRSTGNVALKGFSDAAATRGSLGLIKQATAADPTADRVLMTGAFGLGGDPVMLNPGTSAIAVRPTGFYYCASASDTPAGINGWLRVFYLNANYCAFEFTQASDGARFVGARLNGAWSGWKAADTSRGSNATGQWVIHPSGWMTCTQQITTGTNSWSMPGWGAYIDCGSWPLPATFSQVLGVWAQTRDGQVGGRSAYVPYIAASGANITSLFLATPSASFTSSSITIYVMTMGLV